MPNADFQSRLQRIHASPSLHQPAASTAPQTEQIQTPKTNFALLILAGCVVALDFQAIKYLNANAASIQNSIGSAALIGFGAISYIVFLAGIVAMARAVIKRRISQPVRTPSKKMRTLSSLTGFTLGATVCLAMFMSAAAKFVGTETAQFFSICASLASFLLFCLSALTGLIGLFFRSYSIGKYALWRIPVYFLCGGVLTFAAVRMAGVNLLKWPFFIAMLQ